MSAQFVYRSYKSGCDAAAVRKKLDFEFRTRGYIRTGNSGAVEFYRYPSLRFTSKKPLTCVSRLSLEVTKDSGGSRVTAGVTFTKVKYFTVFVMLMFCAVIPVTLGIVLHGVFDLPPISYLGIPLGFMVHYHVRGRVFRALGRLVSRCDEE